MLPSFKQLDYLGQKWNAQADRPIVEMEFYHRAHLLAELAFICYWNEKYVREVCEHIGFEVTDFLDFEGAQAYVIRNENDTVVACRGTEANDWNDIRADLKVWKVVAETVGKVHGGFKDEVDHLWPALEVALRENENPLHFTGHSLGGAMAQICAGRCQLSEIDSEPAEVQTFGSPRVGNKRYITHYDIRKIRWVNNNDFVTRFPPALFGYRHTGLEMYIDGDGNISGLTGLRRISDGISSFFKGIVRARFDHFADHLMPGYVLALLNAAKDEGDS